MLEPRTLADTLAQKYGGRTTAYFVALEYRDTLKNINDDHPDDGRAAVLYQYWASVVELLTPIRKSP